MEVQDPLPRMRRDLKVQMFETADESFILLTDPWAAEETTMTLSEISYLVLQLMDGRRTLRDIQIKLNRFTGGLMLPLSQLQRLIEQFTELVLLEDEQYHSRCVPMRQAYLKSTSRQAAHAGVSYPETREELELYLDKVLSLAASREGSVPPADKIRAVIAPHLDLRVEEEAYATAYHAIAGRDPDRIILLGTGHEIQDGLFCLTLKDYETPLGSMPCDREAVQMLKDAAPTVCSPDDLPHRDEHALEFQVPFLQKVLARSDVPIVPILCGSLHEELEGCRKPSDIPGVPKFIEALQGLVTERTLFVAGVDFSHIGQKFGHGVPASTMLDAARRHDQNLLDALCAGALDDFWGEVQSVQNSYHVCGFATLCLLLETLSGCKGHVLRHDFWKEDETESAVSFASVVLT